MIKCISSHTLTYFSLNVQSFALKEIIQLEDFLCCCKVHQRFCVFRALLFSLITWKQKPHNKFERKVEKFFAPFSHSFSLHSSMCSALNARILALDRKTFQNFSFSNFVFFEQSFSLICFLCAVKKFFITFFFEKNSVCSFASSRNKRVRNEKLYFLF